MTVKAKHSGTAKITVRYSKGKQSFKVRVKKHRSYNYNSPTNFDSDDWGVSALDRRTYIWDMAENVFNGEHISSAKAELYVYSGDV